MKGELEAQELTRILRTQRGFRIRYFPGTGGRLHVRLNSRTQENLERLRRAFLELYGEARTVDLKKRDVIPAAIGTIRLVPRIAPEHLPPDVVIEVKSGYTAALTKELRKHGLYE